MVPIVDVHTHVYPPKYMELLRARSTVPYVRTFPEAPDSARLIILPGEDDPSTPSTSRGRPIGSEYYDVREKIQVHGPPQDRHVCYLVGKPMARLSPRSRSR